MKAPNENAGVRLTSRAIRVVGMMQDPFYAWLEINKSPLIDARSNGKGGFL
jgi:hypothetical protein